jgi:hypothetical protein
MNIVELYRVSGETTAGICIPTVSPIQHKCLKCGLGSRLMTRFVQPARRLQPASTGPLVDPTAGLQTLPLAALGSARLLQRLQGSKAHRPHAIAMNSRIAAQELPNSAAFEMQGCEPHLVDE